MSAGTITLTNNSAAVTGSGTAFTTELAAGDFIVVTVGGVPYTLPVKTVNSNTSLTLVSNYTGPTQSGAAWSAVPRVALNMVTAALVAQSAEALRGLNYDKQNWQSIFSGTGNVTVKLPDGTEFTGPAWNELASSLANKANASDVMLKGAQGAPYETYRFFRTDHTIQNNVNINNASEAGLYPGMINFSNATNPPVTSGYGYIVNFGRINKANADWSMCQLSLPHSIGSDSGRFFFRGINSSAWGTWKEITTSAPSDGTLKNIGDDLDTEVSLSNIASMEFKNFTFKDDETETPRRGVISQQIQNIDPKYVREVGGFLHLDQTPMLLDGLAAIQALLARDKENKAQIADLRRVIEKLI